MTTEPSSAQRVASRAKTILGLGLALTLAGCTARAGFLDREAGALDELTGLDAQILNDRAQELVAQRNGELRRERLRLLRAMIDAIEPPRRPRLRRPCSCPPPPTPISPPR